MRFSTKNNIIQFSFLVFLVASSCSFVSLLSASSSANEDDIFKQKLMNQYLEAVDRADDQPPSLPISNTLIPIVRTNHTLKWEQDRVYIVTWTANPLYQDFLGQEVKLSNITKGNDVWVTIVPEVINFCRNLTDVNVDKDLRLEQLLGLPPDSPHTHFVELVVKPAALFRPSSDPEINDTRAERDFPLNQDRQAISDPHRKWFMKTIKKSYQLEDKYPWTRLGYTYDWGNPSNPVGLSEFILRQNAKIQVHSVTPTDQYCNHT